jgi:hypothetical protein
MASAHSAPPTTYILKLPLGVNPQGIDLSTSVENEWLGSEIVRAYGLEVAKCWRDTLAIVLLQPVLDDVLDRVPTQTGDRRQVRHGHAAAQVFDERLQAVRVADIRRGKAIRIRKMNGRNAYPAALAAR